MFPLALLLEVEMMLQVCELHVLYRISEAFSVIYHSHLLVQGLSFSLQGTLYPLFPPLFVSMVTFLINLSSNL